MNRKERNIALVLFVLTGLVLPGLFHVPPSQQQLVREDLPFLLRTGLSEIRLAEVLRSTNQEDFADLILFDAAGRVSEVSHLEARDRDFYLRTLALACAAVGRRDDAGLILSRGEVSVEEEDPLHFVIDGGYVPDARRLSVDLEVSGLPDWTREIIGTTYSGEEPPSEEISREATRVQLASFSMQLFCLLASMLVILLAGLVLLGLSSRLLARHGRGRPSVGLEPFAVSPVNVYLLFALWFTFAMGVAPLVNYVLPEGTGLVWVLAASTVLHSGLGVLLVARRGMPRSGSVLASVDLDARSLSGRSVVFGLAGYAVAVPVVLVLSQVSMILLGSDYQSIHQAIPIFVNADTMLDRLALGGILVVLAPLFEEFFFRGFLFRQFQRYFGLANGVLLSALVFASVHLSIESFFPLFGLGVVLAIVYHYTQSLWAAVITHAAWNLGTVIAVATVFG